MEIVAMAANSTGKLECILNNNSSLAFFLGMVIGIIIAMVVYICTKEPQNAKEKE